jgi:hypothetical protein
MFNIRFYREVSFIIFESEYFCITEQGNIENEEQLKIAKFQFVIGIPTYESSKKVRCALVPLSVGINILILLYIHITSINLRILLIVALAIIIKSMALTIF